MGWLKAIIVNILTFLSVAPFISFFLFWFIFYAKDRDKKKATQLAMDVTVIFLIISVSVMFNEIFKVKFGFWLIALFILLGTGFMGNAQHRRYGKLDLVRIYKVVWRISFLILAFFYVLFVIIGIITT